MKGGEIILRLFLFLCEHIVKGIFEGLISVDAF